VALALRPGNIIAYNNLGKALAAQKKLPDAIAAFRKAIGGSLFSAAFAKSKFNQKSSGNRACACRSQVCLRGFS
jgi:Tetratricopeptide repeat